MMCNQDYDIRAVATVGAVNSEIEITLEWSTNYVGAFAYSGYPALYAYQTMVFGGDIISSGGAQAINEGDIPALVIHCENDGIVWEQLHAPGVFSVREKATISKRAFAENGSRGIFLITGTPATIAGLDEGHFLSAKRTPRSKDDIFVMPYPAFKLFSPPTADV